MFIEGKKIASETPQEDGMVLVSYEDGSTERISSELIEHIRTEEAIDATALRERSSQPIVKEILTVLHRFDPRVEDVTYILQTVGTSLMRNIVNADDAFYGVPKEDRRVRLFHDILIKKNVEIPEGK
jgi:hypothetical protein